MKIAMEDKNVRQKNKNLLSYLRNPLISYINSIYDNDVIFFHFTIVIA